MSNRLVMPVFGLGFVLLIVLGCYLQWQIWQAL